MVKACKKLPKSIYNNLKYGIIKIEIGIHKTWLPSKNGFEITSLIACRDVICFIC